MLEQNALSQGAGKEEAPGPAGFGVSWLAPGSAFEGDRQSRSSAGCKHCWKEEAALAGGRVMIDNFLCCSRRDLGNGSLAQNLLQGWSEQEKLSAPLRGGKSIVLLVLSWSILWAVLGKELRGKCGADECPALLLVKEAVIPTCCVNTGRSDLNLSSCVTGRKEKAKTNKRVEAARSVSLNFGSSQMIGVGGGSFVCLLGLFFFFFNNLRKKRVVSPLPPSMCLVVTEDEQQNRRVCQSSAQYRNTL